MPRESLSRHRLLTGALSALQALLSIPTTAHQGKPASCGLTRLRKTQADGEGLQRLSLALIPPSPTTGNHCHPRTGCSGHKALFPMLFRRTLNVTAIVDLNCPCYQAQPGHRHPSEKEGGVGDAPEGESQRSQDAPDHPLAFKACPAPAPVACSGEGTWPPWASPTCLPQSLCCWGKTNA